MRVVRLSLLRAPDEDNHRRLTSPTFDLPPTATIISVEWEGRWVHVTYSEVT